jgi:2-methylcitrate dehydratase PrpD
MLPLTPAQMLSNSRNVISKSYILINTFKMHAACLLLHPAIDGLLSLRKEYGLKPEDIANVELEVAPLCLDVTDKPEVTNPTGGKFSIYFCAAQALMGGKVGSGEFTEAALNDPAIRKLMQKVRVKTNPSVKETETSVILQTLNGKRYTRHVSAFRGDPDNPLGFEDIEEKFTALNAGLFSAERMQAIADCIRDFDKLADIAGFPDMCSFIQL